MEYEYIKDPRKFHNRYLQSMIGRKIHPDSNLLITDVSSKMEFMSPTKYLGLELPIGGREAEHHQYQAEIERVESVKNKIRNGIPIDPLFLMINIRNNRIIAGDGTHRALAAQDLGVKKVPVYIIYVQIIQDKKGKHFITNDDVEDLTWLTREEDSTYGVDIRNKNLSKNYIPDQIIFTPFNEIEPEYRKKRITHKKPKPKRKVIKKCKCK